MELYSNGHIPLLYICKTFLLLPTLLSKGEMQITYSNNISQCALQAYIRFGHEIEQSDFISQILISYLE